MLIFGELIQSFSREKEHDLESFVSATTSVRRWENIHFRDQLEKRWILRARAPYIGRYNHILD